MNVDSFDTVFFTVGFLVPGFVWSAVLSMLLPRRSPGGDVRFLEFLTLSCIKYGRWSWATFLIFRTSYLDNHPYWSSLFLVGIIFLSPVGLGLGSVSFKQRAWVGRFLRRWGFRTIDPIPTAWDWKFSRTDSRWVLVTLKNGAKVFGFFGERSFAGDDPSSRDLYLEATFRTLQNGEWAPVEDTDGILIMPDQIAAIEFRKLADETNE